MVESPLCEAVTPLNMEVLIRRVEMLWRIKERLSGVGGIDICRRRQDKDGQIVHGTGPGV